MSVVTGTPANPIADPDDGNHPIRVVRLTREQHLAGAARLVGHQTSDPMEAGQRFLDSARSLGIDLSHMFATLNPDGSARQVCLGVVGSGRTLMLFVSSDTRAPRMWTSASRTRGGAGGSGGVGGEKGTVNPQDERVAIVNHVCQTLTRTNRQAAEGVSDTGPCLAQALLEEREREVAQALRLAGFTQLGDLAYLRRPLPASGPGRDLKGFDEPAWPKGSRVESVAALLARLGDAAAVDRVLCAALERTYVDTLDCPELCGMRRVGDVLDSHRAVGDYDPALWWIVFDAADTPAGCLLLTPCPEHQSVELVYIGLGVELRGCGLGATLLRFGIRQVYDQGVVGKGEQRVSGAGGLTCAVDTRNPAALRLYRAAGFQRFALRLPFVRSLEDPPLGAR